MNTENVAKAQQRFYELEGYRHYHSTEVVWESIWSALCKHIIITNGSNGLTMNSITEKHEISRNTDYTSHLTRGILTRMINYGRMKNHVMQLSFASQTTRGYLFHSSQIKSNHIRYKFEKRRCIHSVY